MKAQHSDHNISVEMLYSFTVKLGKSTLEYELY